MYNHVCVLLSCELNQSINFPDRSRQKENRRLIYFVYPKRCARITCPAPPTIATPGQRPLRLLHLSLPFSLFCEYPLNLCGLLESAPGIASQAICSLRWPLILLFQPTDVVSPPRPSFPFFLPFVYKSNHVCKCFSGKTPGESFISY